MNEYRKRLRRLILTTLSKKQLSAIFIMAATLILIWNGKFAGESAWFAFAAALAYVGAVHHIDLKTKELFPNGANNVATSNYSNGGP